MKKENKYWSERLSIGNPDIDNDHKKLLEVFADMTDFAESSREREEFAEILSKMTDYSLRHFKTEEVYMQNLSYPKLKDHKNEHYDYIHKVAMFNINFLNSELEPAEIINFVGEWWTNHILNMDIMYEKYKRDLNLEAKYRRF